MIAEHIDLEYRAQSGAGQVFDRTGAGKGPVVVQGVEAGGTGFHLGHGGGDAGLIGVVEGEAFQPFALVIDST